MFVTFNHYVLLPKLTNSHLPVHICNSEVINIQDLNQVVARLLQLFSQWHIETE